MWKLLFDIETRDEIDTVLLQTPLNDRKSTTQRLRTNLRQLLKTTKFIQTVWLT